MTHKHFVQIWMYFLAWFNIYVYAAGCNETTFYILIDHLIFNRIKSVTRVQHSSLLIDISLKFLVLIWSQLTIDIVGSSLLWLALGRLGLCVDSRLDSRTLAVLLADWQAACVHGVGVGALATASSTLAWIAALTLSSLTTIPLLVSCPPSKQTNGHTNSHHYCFEY